MIRRACPPTCASTPSSYHRLDAPDDGYLLVFERNHQRYYLLQDSGHSPYLELMIDGFAPLVNDAVALILNAPQNTHAHPHVEVARSVICNLSRNACQYTEQGEIHLAVQGTTLVISDTGSGLPTSIDPWHFQRFQHSTRLSGEGPGLSIVQCIVEHLGGTWWSTAPNRAATLPWRCTALSDQDRKHLAYPDLFAG